MSGTAPVSAVLPERTHLAAARHGPETWVALLAVRLLRRGVLLLALVAALYMAVEVITYRQTYPDAASRESLAKLEDDPAVRMLQGVPHAVETPGGFAVWDGGWFLAVIAAIWALLAAGRILRAEEDSGRAELVLAAPVRASRVVILQSGVLGAAALVVGAAATVALALAGTGVAGSVLFGLAVAGIAATFAGVAAVGAQVFDARRRTTGVSAAVLGGMFLVRMVGNGADGYGWLRWLSPFGWLDELHPYREPRWTALALFCLVPVLLGALAVGLRARRDTGGALLTQPDHSQPRLRLLRGPGSFAWRGTQGMLLGWLAGIAAYAFIAGTMVTTVAEFVADDPNYRELLETMGLDVAKAAQGFVGVMGTVIGLLVALFACWRIGAARAEEATGRLEHVLTRPVTRRRWLGGHVLLTLVSSVLLALTAGVVLWGGIAVTGGGVSFTGACAAILNTLPVVVLFTGVAVLLFGARPRLTVAGAVAAAATAYLIVMIGPTLKWPALVLGASPFYHLALVPAEPFAPLAAAVMTALGLTMLGTGMVLFGRRDLTGD